MTPSSKNTEYISLSSLDDYPTMRAFLSDCFGHGILRLKKSGLDKKFIIQPVHKKQEIKLPLELVNYGHISPFYEGPEIEILFEDEDFIAMSKPVGIHSHPLDYFDDENCLSFLRNSNQGPEVLNVNISNYDRGLLYRLDKETSGVLVATKRDYLYRDVRENYGSLVKEKIYLAIVQGSGPKRGIACHFLRPSGKKGEMMEASEQCVEGSDLKLARLEFEQLESRKDPDVSLYRIKLLQGLRHQIRVQLSALGMPILGDVKYGGQEADRLYLHSLAYTIETDGIKKLFTDSKPYLFDKLFNLDRIMDMFSDE